MCHRLNRDLVNDSRCLYSFLLMFIIPRINSSAAVRPFRVAALDTCPHTAYTLLVRGPSEEVYPNLADQLDKETGQVCADGRRGCSFWQLRYLAADRFTRRHAYGFA